MQDNLETKLVLILAGGLAGILSGAIGAWAKNLLDRRESQLKSEAEIRLQFLYPLLIAAVDFQSNLRHIFEILQREKDILRPEPEMTDRYYLRYYLWRCKEYATNSDPNWTSQARARELAMYSGGVGYDAVSANYIAAAYLSRATRIRLQIPSELKGRGIRLVEQINRVREGLNGLHFYNVAQDTTGASVTCNDGKVMNYREFCEALTDESTRAWFLTLTDVYFELHRKSSEEVDRVIEALDGLITLIREMLMIDRQNRDRRNLIEAGLRRL